MTDNGILSRIAGNYISDAINTLPKPETAPDHLTTELDLPDLGRVRFTARRQHRKHGRSSHWFWVVIHAELTVPKNE